MKRLLSIIIVIHICISFCFSLAGCSISNSPVTTPETKNISKQTDLESIQKTDYSNLSKSQMLTIIHWIENRYEYYDGIDGKYTGDKYTKTIFNEAASRYNKTYDQISNIWNKSYELKYGE